MRLVKCLQVAVLGTALSIGLAACGGGGDDDDGPPPLDTTGTHTQYVVDQLTLPTTAAQANQLGINLDGDDQGRPDNALGQILSTLASQSGDVNLQETIDEQVDTGEIILLANVQAKALTTATGVGLWIFLGANPSDMPCASDTDTVCRGHLGGSTSFDIDQASPEDALIVGQIVGGKFTGGPGTVTIEISLVAGTQLTLNLIGARAEINAVSETGLMSGKLGGAVTEDDLNTNILPALQEILADTIDEDCTGVDNGMDACGCEDGATGRTLLDLFDETLANGDPGQDCMVTLTELEENSLISSLLAPDVDLLDGNGNFNPRDDGIKDSLSLGLGFTAVGGSFTLPSSIANPM